MAAIRTVAGFIAGVFAGCPGAFAVGSVSSPISVEKRLSDKDNTFAPWPNPARCLPAPEGRQQLPQLRRSWFRLLGVGSAGIGTTVVLFWPCCWHSTSLPRTGCCSLSTIPTWSGLIAVGCHFGNSDAADNEHPDVTPVVPGCLLCRAALSMPAVAIDLVCRPCMASPLDIRSDAIGVSSVCWLALRNGRPLSVILGILGQLGLFPEMEPILRACRKTILGCDWRARCFASPASRLGFGLFCFFGFHHADCATLFRSTIAYTTEQRPQIRIEV